MANFFGQSATYDAIEGRFRRYRKMADELKQEARALGITNALPGRGSGGSTPRTPRATRGVTKKSSTGKAQKGTPSNLTSPTRRAIASRSGNGGMSTLDAICLDDTSEDDQKDTKLKTDTRTGPARLADAPLWGQHGAAVQDQGGPDLEIVGAPVPAEDIFPKLEERENSMSIFSSFPSLEGFKGKEADRDFPSVAPSMGLSRTGTTLEQTNMNEDPFYQSDPYFPINHAAYPMDNTYFDEGGMA
ncbi:uncharacterized protein KD926_010902 [Aspergillus affinis]|uniref:uncharacterized protein n=1 Tax=Aspergillus affinis TaxID=1070780 RepID=UPI0022FEB37D|nr:uncharacterized protein KD926_010902 [Aspergillus affinis]KAI9038366.1 hypothetical protein KD926_010902 [Aspergillus affinis]